MIYFDNAATTYPKPKQVIASMSAATARYGGNPGRAGHKLSMETAEAVFAARMKCAGFFGAEPENTIFTLNCTHALNLAIKGLLSPNAHLITSDIEHNAVIRPIHASSKANNISYTIARTYENDDETVKSFERLITKRTKAIVCTAAGNVSGRILPYQKIGKMCQRRGICFVLDAAQGAGVLPIKLSDGINIICAAGHKSLYGPMGTGLMITDGKYRLKTIIEGGTGSKSKEIEQPQELPDRFESGTINTTGAIALADGISFVEQKTISVIRNHENSLCEMFFGHMKENSKIKLYSKVFHDRLAPLVPFNLKGMNSSDAAKLMSDAGFYLRGGFHCAFLGHRKIGTADIGAVRFAPSAFNSKTDVMSFIKLVNKLTEQA
ncbi:MAG: aminotransferase class V-fold PLP-dependent enzyme [Eubacterium sp.]|jgi:cysteine desulfurase family protein|nr:aminotransferase class V-fold PLP-dependent enzyme [Eubacterium sp.]